MYIDKDGGGRGGGWGLQLLLNFACQFRHKVEGQHVGSRGRKDGSKEFLKENRRLPVLLLLCDRREPIRLDLAAGKKSH